MSTVLDKILACLPEAWNILDVCSAVMKGGVVFSSAVLAGTGIAGYSFYIGFMRQNPNTMKRLINVYHGQFAICEQLYALAIVAGVIRHQLGFKDDSMAYEIFSQTRPFLGFCSTIAQFLIAVATLMKKFFPDTYQETSDKWTFKKSMWDLFIVTMVHGGLNGVLLLSSKDRKAFYKALTAVYSIVVIILLGLTLLIQLGIIFAENKKTVQLKMNQIFKSNAVVPDQEAHADNMEQENEDMDDNDQENMDDNDQEQEDTSEEAEVGAGF